MKAIYAIEHSGTYFWGLTSYELFARTKYKDTWITWDDNGKLQGIVIVEMGKIFNLSIITAKGFNPIAFFVVWERLKEFYLTKIPKGNLRLIKKGIEIPNPRLRKLAKRFGFKEKRGRYVPPIENYETISISTKINTKRSSSDSRDGNRRRRGRTKRKTPKG